MDRKARIREYKDTPRPMGVFRVRNTVNGRCFIGSSVDLPAMLNRQRFQLELGGHPDRALQSDFNEMGLEAFELEVVDTLEAPEEPGADVSADLNELELMWLHQLGCLEGRYGLPRGSGG